MNSIAAPIAFRTKIYGGFVLAIALVDVCIAAWWFTYNQPLPI